MVCAMIKALISISEGINAETSKRNSPNTLVDVIEIYPNWSVEQKER